MPCPCHVFKARVWELFRHVALDAGFAAKYLDYAQGANLTNRMPLFVETGPHVALNTTFWQMRRHYETSWFDTTTDVGCPSLGLDFDQFSLLFQPHAAKHTPCLAPNTVYALLHGYAHQVRIGACNPMS